MGAGALVSVLTGLFLVVTSAVAPAPSVAVLALDAKTGVPPEMADLLSEKLVDEVRSANVFARVIGAKELETLVGFERQKQLVNCDNDSCLAELAGVLGVDMIVAGSVGKVGNTALLTLRLLDTKHATALASVSQSICALSDENVLHAMHPAVLHLLARGKLGPPQAAPLVDEKCGGEPVRVTPDEGNPGLRRGLMGVGIGLGVVALVQIPLLVLSLGLTGGELAVISSVRLLRMVPHIDGTDGTVRYAALNAAPVATGVAGGLTALLLVVAGMGAAALLVGAFMVH